MSEGPLLLDVERAGVLLGLGRTQVYNLMNGGELRFIKVGKRRLIPRVALDEFIEKKMAVSK